MTTAVVCAALCAGAAVWVAVDGDGCLRRPGPTLAGGRVVVEGTPRWQREKLQRVLGRLRREWLLLPAALALAVLGQSVLPLIAGAVAVPLVGRWLRAAEREKAGEARAGSVIALCEAIASELRAGRQPGAALSVAGRATGALGDSESAVLAAARFGGDVPGELRRAAGAPGAAGLAGLAACWRVAVDGGAGLACGLDRLHAALRAERDQREQLHAQLTGVRSTVVVLALLPVVGLGLGWALGAQPLRVLLHTPGGLGCLLLGGLLEAAGLCWAARVVRAGERP
ncbi:type II secretion system F family protein [Streptomyces sp. NPDC059169]|uniref:type II secretion system F family protein n=1 Tax=unclassified Streptomyces TaxID=2593676 RepID=UPI00368A68DF